MDILKKRPPASPAQAAARFAGNSLRAGRRKRRGPLLPLLLSAFLAASSFSCSARIDGEVGLGGGADLRFRASLEPGAAALIRSLRSFAGGPSAAPDPAAPVLDGRAMGASLAAAPGIQAVSVRNDGPSALDGTISLSNAGDFLASGDAGSRFAVYTEGREAGTSSIVVTLDRNSAPALISRLSPEVEECLLALMAPVAIGERASRQDYLEMVGAVYGKALADEIAAARIRASIEFPRNVVEAKGGRPGETRFSGTRAEFDIPLADILVLEAPLRFEVRW